MNRIRLRIRVCRNGFLSALAQALMAAGFALIFWSGCARAAEPAFRVLAFYSTDVELDHVKTAKDALAFYSDRATKENFILDTTTDWTKLNENDLKPYRLILWLNNFPQTPDQRAACEKYMEDGGGWIGFHVAAYNDKDTHWPWFVQFLGGAVFYTNNWPVLPAKLNIDDRNHPVTAGLPATYDAPANEWYLWKPSPRLNKDVQVLVTLAPSNYPIGKKDIITEGDLPVVWTNTKYRMLYINMGHGPAVYGDPTQNKLFENAILWLGNKK
jgi:uncharacterized protein